jgi:hypothetical protein
MLSGLAEGSLLGSVDRLLSVEVGILPGIVGELSRTVDPLVGRLADRDEGDLSGTEVVNLVGLLAWRLDGLLFGRDVGVDVWNLLTGELAR